MERYWRGLGLVLALFSGSFAVTSWVDTVAAREVIKVDTGIGLVRAKQAKIKGNLQAYEIKINKPEDPSNQSIDFGGACPRAFIRAKDGLNNGPYKFLFNINGYNCSDGSGYQSYEFQFDSATSYILTPTQIQWNQNSGTDSLLLYLKSIIGDNGHDTVRFQAKMTPSCGYGYPWHYTLSPMEFDMVIGGSGSCEQYTKILLNAHNDSAWFQSVKADSGLFLGKVPAASAADSFLVLQGGPTVKRRSASQVLSDIGAAGSIPNPDSGSGTAGYVTKFLSANKLGNSIIQDNGTAIGFNTAPSASYMFDFSGATSNYLAHFANTGTYAYLAYGTNGVNHGPCIYGGVDNHVGTNYAFILYNDLGAMMGCMADGTAFYSKGAGVGRYATCPLDVYLYINDRYQVQFENGSGGSYKTKSYFNYDDGVYRRAAYLLVNSASATDYIAYFANANGGVANFDAAGNFNLLLQGTGLLHCSSAGLVTSSALTAAEMPDSLGNKKFNIVKLDSLYGTGGIYGQRDGTLKSSGLKIGNIGANPLDSMELFLRNYVGATGHDTLRFQTYITALCGYAPPPAGWTLSPMEFDMVVPGSGSCEGTTKILANMHNDSAWFQSVNSTNGFFTSGGFHGSPSDSTKKVPDSLFLKALTISNVFGYPTGIHLMKDNTIYFHGAGDTSYWLYNNQGSKKLDIDAYFNNSVLPLISMNLTKDAMNNAVGRIDFGDDSVYASKGYHGGPADSVVKLPDSSKVNTCIIIGTGTVANYGCYVDTGHLAASGGTTLNLAYPTGLYDTTAIPISVIYKGTSVGVWSNDITYNSLTATTYGLIYTSDADHHSARYKVIFQRIKEQNKP